MKFGDIYMADLAAFIGTDESRVSNVIILQNTVCDNPETVWCAKISAKIERRDKQFISLKNCGVDDVVDSYILLDHSGDIEVNRLSEKIASVSEEFLNLLKKETEEKKYHYIVEFHDGVTVLELAESSSVAQQNARSFMKKMSNEHKENYSTHVFTVKMTDNEMEWNNTDLRDGC